MVPLRRRRRPPQKTATTLKRPTRPRRPRRSRLLAMAARRRLRHRLGHPNRPPLRRHRYRARNRHGVLRRNRLKPLILAACHTRGIRTNRRVAAVRTTRRRRVATADHGETAAATFHGAWDEAGADIAAVAAIVVKDLMTARDPSEVVPGAVDAAVTAVAQEGMGADRATTADTTTDHLRRITRWAAATRARADTTKDRLRGNSSTPDNLRTRRR